MLTPPRRIAIFRALFLGDLLCAVPALRALRRRFRAAEVTLIGLPWAGALVERLPDVDRFEAFPGYAGIDEVAYDSARTKAYLSRAQAAGYDLALQMHGDGHVSNGFVAALGARASLGYGCEADDRLTLGLRYRAEEHEILRWLRLVAALGAETDDVRPAFPTFPAEEGRAAALLNRLRPGRGPVVGLHPGAKEAARRWPADCFAALGDALAERLDARIVLTGGAAERELTAAVGERLRSPALDLGGATDLGTFAAAIARFDLLVTNDTGASHVAAAVGTPSVILFGPSRPSGWAPLDRERHRAVDALVLAGPGADPATALRRLPLEPVLSACERALRAGADEGAASSAPPNRLGAGLREELPCGV